MKRVFFFSILAVLLVGLVLASCGDETSETTASTSATSQTTATSATSETTATSATSETTTAGTSPGTPAEAVEWKAQVLYPAGDLLVDDAFPLLTEEIDKKLEGRLKVTQYAADEIVPSDQLIDAVSSGVLDMALLGFSQAAQYIPEALVGFGLPGAWKSFDDAMNFWYEGGGIEFMRESYAEENVFLLGPIMQTGNTFMFKKEIKSLDDLKGLKLFGLGVMQPIIQSLGAAPTSVPMADLFMALETGTLDGLGYSEPEIKTMNLYQVVPYVYHPRAQDVLAVSVVVNMDSWNALAPEDQQAVLDLYEELVPVWYDRLNQATEEGLQYLKDNGGQLADFPPDVIEAMEKASVEQFDTLAAKGGRMKEAIDLVKAARQ